jgi:hypothetical protein
MSETISVRTEDSSEREEGAVEATHENDESSVWGKFLSLIF